MTNAAIELPEPTETPPAPRPDAELAALLAARLCHDLLSPASAIVSGLDLLDDPSAADMREEAMGLITTSARKLADLLMFQRVAFGASASAQDFDPAELEALAQSFYGHSKATLEWGIEAGRRLPKPAARSLLNLAQIASAALPTGGVAKISERDEGEGLCFVAEAEGLRARLRPETLAGLKGEPLGEGLGGQWVLGAYLAAIVGAAGGRLDVETAEGRIVIAVRLPRAAA